ncbi:TRAP transporter substrate-binding protein [Phreatobacter oligotrophus]|uniref:Secreted protein n=1 Tax=Phreatobacter oligotrophus TaxID=1122261 RepID=A0A2T4Z5X1_9HYPH|nr:TRAP transporter substrate-binding protein DctP [Phreatobacter oligotrophus]MCZ8321073.1 TRAP transporter substrate-binding protein DctP [Novosphingobium sp.]PTM57273.1 secreted protein [Phreatobacter oligotrophus]
MSRRMFLKGAAVAGAATLAAPALGQTAQVRWRMATSWPKSLDTIYGSAAALGERVSQITEGRFQIQVFAGGEIVPPLAVFDAVSNGTVEMGHTLSSYFFGKNSAYAFDGGLPFGLNTRQQQAWMVDGGGAAMMRELFGKSNIVPFPVGNVGVQMGGWYRKEINTVEDLQGLKIRIGGLGGSIFRRLGAVPQQIPAGDIYPSLERGTIDAAEWIGPYDDEKLGFGRVARFYYTPGWFDGAAQITSYVNAAKWAELPKPFQAAFEAAANEQVMQMMATYDRRNPDALKRLVASGVQLRAFPRPVLEACYRATVAQCDELATQNPDFARIYTAWKTFHDDQNLWFRVAENTLDQFRYSTQGWGRS